MQKNNLIKQLLAVEPAGFPFVSAYLNTEPDQNGKFNYKLTAENLIKENAVRFEEGTPERDSYDRDAEAISERLDKVDPSTKGIALFACSGNGFFKAVEFDVPFHEDLFFAFEKPHVYPLVRMIERNPPFAVLLADTNSAHIFVFRGGEMLERHDVQNEKTNRTEVGGWSQARYQRHIENFHQQHAKEAVEELEKITRAENLEHVILAGDESVIIPLLRAELNPELEKKVAGVLPLNVRTPAHEVLDSAGKAINAHRTITQKERVDFLNEQNYEDGIGVTGVEKTLAALFNGQVQELLISSDFDTIKYDYDSIWKTLKAYEPGVDAALPPAGEQGMIIDELIKQAVDSAENITFIEDENLLKEFGGIGAILRYQVKGVTNA
jgi:peptide chain release factor subunit 1